jgi:hypothetical protein
MTKLLKSKFNIGFELEGIFDYRKYDSDELCDKLDEKLGGCGDIHGDGSVRANEPGYRPFEYSSPIIEFKPRSIKQMIDTLNSLSDIDVKVNRSCGFHTHISYEGIKFEDLVWFQFYICATGKYKEFLKMGRTALYNRTYAKYTYLESVEKYIKDGYYQWAVGELSTTDKYRVFRIHPQGTLEWRGPRTFLNTPSKKKTMTFIKKLNDVISTIIESKNTDQVIVNGNTITKVDIIERIKNYRNSISFEERGTKRTFYQYLMSNIYTLDKFNVKELNKHKEDISKFVSSRNMIYSRIFESQRLFKWAVDNNIDETIFRCFKAKTLLNNADVLYNKCKLLETMKNISDDAKYEDQVKLLDFINSSIKEKKYINTIYKFITYLIKMRFNYTSGVVAYLLSNTNILELLNEDEKKEINYLITSRYGCNTNSFDNTFICRLFVKDYI